MQLGKTNVNCVLKMSTEAQNLRDDLVKQNPGMANYKIVFNQSPKSHALLLQFPTREAWKPYSNQTGQKPTELRIKPKCGYIEVDVPIPIGKQWNVDQAITFQDAISKSPTLLRGGSLGLPGGLLSNLKPIPPETVTNPAHTRPSREQLLANADDDDNKEYMMSKITLQGQIHPRDDTQPRYLMGTFKGGELSNDEWQCYKDSFLTLSRTPLNGRLDTCFMSQVDAIVQLSPVPIHIDAINELARSTNRFQRNSDRNDEEGEAKAVNLTIKSSEPEDVEGVGERSGIAKMLKDIAEEPWQRLQWIDQDVRVPISDK